MPTDASAPARSSWAGIPADERRALRRERLLDAAFELMGTEGWAATTVRGVCQGAQLNPRYFYESFADLDALLVAVYDRVAQGLADAVLGAMAQADPDPAVQVRVAIGTTVRYVDDDRRRGRVLYVEALGHEALNRRRKEAGGQLVDFLARDAEDIGRIGASILVGGFSELLANWLEGRIKVSRAQLVDDASALFLSLGETATAIAARRAARPRGKR